ncbi:MAG: DNA translocase FtsK [Bacteroidaceae bacterium]|nr:DNA translocase FtsK [Bacteroidaceae bacterium]
MAKKTKEKGTPKTVLKTSEKEGKKDNVFKNIFSTIKNEIGQFIVGLVLALVAFYMLIAFISFFTTGAADQSILENTATENMGVGNNIQNSTGALGAQLANYLINGCFGIAAFFIVIFMGVAGMKLMRAYRVNLTKWFISCSLLLIWFSIALGFLCGASFADSHIIPGGMHGYNVSNWICSQIGAPGMGLLLLVTAILFAIYLSRETINLIRKMLHPNIPLDKLKRYKNFSPTEEKVSSDERENQEGETTSEQEGGTTVIDLDLTDTPADNLSLTIDQPLTSEEQEEKDESPAQEEEIEMIVETSEKEEVEKTDIEEKPMEMEVDVPEDEEKGEEMEPYNPKLDLENYRYPTLDLLKKYENNTPSVNPEELNANKNRIIEVLRNFGVEIASIKATVGPTITLYEITPAPGVRIAKIRNLENDIALSLAALGIRIIAPIPGKGTIGIEVPNANKRIVSMESILTSKKYQESDMELPVAVGKTISNEVYMFDLAKAPHLLVAGATGMGKSVGLNAIVTSLLYKKHPAELKFVIIDPKKVEFSIYAPIENHFLAKLPDSGDAIITDVDKVVQTLNSLCVEMDTRYDLLKSAGARNIIEYNGKFIARRLNPEKGHKYLPYIVVIVDEFGDLIMTAGREVELPIARIAQLARAVGIHMIIATQRPTTNIITGTIKANFPARMAFRTSSMIDSRTILDRPGANQLIGKGDMLYLQGQDPVRIQCAFVDTPEVENIVSHIAVQQSYLSAFELPEPPMEAGDGGGAADVDMNKLDPMLKEAAQLIITHQQGSTSLIQRKFSIGYNRAGRIMDQLERIGVVGPAQGSKPRDVLCQTEMDLDMIMSNL